MTNVVRVGGLVDLTTDGTTNVAGADDHGRNGGGLGDTLDVLDAVGEEERDGAGGNAGKVEDTVVGVAVGLGGSAEGLGTEGSPTDDGRDEGADHEPTALLDLLGDEGDEDHVDGAANGKADVEELGSVRSEAHGGNDGGDEVGCWITPRNMH